MLGCKMNLVLKIWICRVLTTQYQTSYVFEVKHKTKNKTPQKLPTISSQQQWFLGYSNVFPKYIIQDYLLYQNTSGSMKFL